MKVEQVEARDVEVGDVLVNMGEVLDVSGDADVVLIEWSHHSDFWPHPYPVMARRGATFAGSETLHRFPKDGE